MPNQPKTPASSFRFTADELAQMDALSARLTTPGLRPMSRTDVLRVALRRLADAETAEKKYPKKSPRGIDTV